MFGVNHPVNPVHLVIEKLRPLFVSLFLRGEKWYLGGTDC